MLPFFLVRLRAVQKEDPPATPRPIKPTSAEQGLSGSRTEKPFERNVRLYSRFCLGCFLKNPPSTKAQLSLRLVILAAVAGIKCHRWHLWIANSLRFVGNLLLVGRASWVWVWEAQHQSHPSHGLPQLMMHEM